MKRVLIILIIALTAFINCGVAQTFILDRAIDAFEQQNYKQAKILIDSAVMQSGSPDNPETWYYRAGIYKGIYKAQQSDDRFSPAREEAITSLKYFLMLDDSSKFYDSAVKSVKYLASTYYNDAVKDMNNQMFEYSAANYEKHKSAWLLIEKNRNFTVDDIGYKEALGTVYMNLCNTGKERNNPYYEKSIHVFAELLELDPNNWNANYNTGILMYNRAVSIIKDMEYDTDLITLDMVQTNCIKLFFTSLPYMKKAHKLRPANQEPIAGLTGIYFSLNEPDYFRQYKEMLNDQGN